MIDKKIRRKKSKYRKFNVFGSVPFCYPRSKHGLGDFCLPHLRDKVDNFLQVPMNLLGVLLMDISGRRPLLMVQK